MRHYINYLICFLYLNKATNIIMIVASNKVTIKPGMITSVMAKTRNSFILQYIHTTHFCYLNKQVRFSRNKETIKSQTLEHLILLLVPFSLVFEIKILLLTSILLVIKAISVVKVFKNRELLIKITFIKLKNIF